MFQVALFAAALLIPAGTWNWPRAIQFLGAYGVVLVSIVVLGLIAPSSLEARVQVPTSKSQPRSDRIVSAFLFTAIFAWPIFIPVDVFRLHLTPPPSFGVSVFGATVSAAGFGVILVTLYQNAFAAPVVKDQADRGQVVIDTGLYGSTRHPFYLGLLLFLVGLALWLESYASAVAVLVPGAATVARIHVEEQTLRETLPGYADYTNKVRCRLVPGIW